MATDSTRSRFRPRRWVACRAPPTCEPEVPDETRGSAILLKTVYKSTGQGAMTDRSLTKILAVRIPFRHVIPLLALTLSPQIAAGDPLRLSGGWRLQSSANVHVTGKALSRPGAKTAGWHTTAVPSTVVAALLAGRPDEDVFKSTNFRALPGMEYPVGGQFSNLPIPAGSPYAHPWWYRDEFTAPATLEGRAVALHFDGINYRANIWLNGVEIAKATSVAGAFRRYEFDVTRTLRPGARNALAVEVFAPTPGDLGINWVDWNPTPPDKNMGL